MLLCKSAKQDYICTFDHSSILKVS